MSSLWKIFFVFALAAPASMEFLSAQRVTSTIFGTVSDASGAVIPGTEVDVVSLETGLVRSELTDDSGKYRVAGLVSGSYEVRGKLTGFKVTVRRLKLAVNEEVRVDLVLQIGEIEQIITVSGEPPMIKTRNPALSGVVTEEELRDLPLNGRDLFQLTTLETGVAPTTNAGTNPFSDGAITKAAVQGARPSMNNVTLDGGDINDPGFNVPPGGPSGAQLGVEAVKEFRVLLNNYSAEFGRNGGANVQYITKSGSNSVHGSVFEFHRNAPLDARNFFDEGDIPPFIRHQFGVAVGGPIQHDKAFFFFNYEGLRENRSITSSTSVPDDNARLGLLPSAQAPGRLVDVGVDPRVAPLLELFPRANGPSLGGGVGLLRTSRVQETNEDYFLGRIDYNFANGDQLFGRYVIDDGEAGVPFQSTLVPGFDGLRVIRNQYFMLAWQTLATDRLLNEVKFNFNRTRYFASADNEQPLSISLVPNRPLGAINITGLPLLGNNLLFPLGTASNTIEAIDNVVYERGAHNLKFGGNFKRLHINGPFDLFIDGQYLFTDLTGFGIPAATANPPLEFFLRGVPLAYAGIDPDFSDSNRGYRQNYVGLYFQDDWQVRPGLTLNLGLRWEYSSNPAEVNGRNANIQNLLTDTAPTVGDIWESVPLSLFSPRFGFAWTPFGGKKTVLRGGVGIFRDQLWANLYFDNRFYAPFYRPFLAIFPNFQTPPGSLQEVGGFQSPLGSFGVTYRPDFPFYLQYNLNVQRQLAQDLMIELAYAGSKGTHLVRTGEANLTPQGPLNPSFGSIPLIVTDANSFYNSFQLSVRKRFSRGLGFQVSYTLAKSIDDQTGPFPSDWVSESGVAQDFFNRKGDRARSSFDRRHILVVNFLYDLPIGQGAGGFAGGVLGGWQVGGIATLMSGLPFTGNLGSFNNSGNFASFPADRPNLRPGTRPCDAVIGDPDRWFDPTIFTLPAPGQYGDAGRNILCGPDFRNFDFILKKRTHIGERFTLEFRAEFFNIFNRPNFSVPVNTQGPNGVGGNGDAIFLGRRAGGCDPAQDSLGCGLLAPNAGRIFRTDNTSRQIQFGLKLVF